jgi:DNA-binding CsgD family transcriptional regulator
VYDLVRDGKSTGEICRVLGLSRNTIAKHLKAVFRKTGATAKRDLIR